MTKQIHDQLRSVVSSEGWNDNRSVLSSTPSDGETIQFQQTDICICHVISWRHVAVLGVRSSKMAAASNDDDSATGQRAIFVSTTRNLPVASPSLVATGRFGHRGSFLWSVALDALVLNGREGMLIAIHQDGVLVVDALPFIHDVICNL